VTAAIVILFMALVALGRRVVQDAERLRLVAEAEHELRGPLQAIALALGSDPVVQPDIERARIALADLAAARGGRRAAAGGEAVRLDRLVWRAATASDLAARRAGGGVHLDWSAGPVTIRANHGRLAQAIGNLLANAVEHGGAQIRVSGRKTTRGIRVEVRDSGRGHGLTIAAKAIREAGGTLTAARAGSGTAVAIELPIVEVADAPPAAADAHPSGAQRPAARPAAAGPPADQPRAGRPAAAGPQAGQPSAERPPAEHPGAAADPAAAAQLRTLRPIRSASADPPAAA
jgi:signal transduction histidine kinase